MLKIGLTQRVDIIGERRERRDCLDQAWAQLLMQNGYVPVPLPNVVLDTDLLLRELDLEGVILTGGNDLSHLDEIVSPAPERDAFELNVIRACALRKIPLLGVCRGMQMLAHSAGIPVVQVPDHGQAPHGVISRIGHELPALDRGEVNSVHRFGIRESDVRLPWKVAAVAPDGTVEAIAHESLPQAGIMWHLEWQPASAEDLKLLHHFFRASGSGSTTIRRS